MTGAAVVPSMARGGDGFDAPRAAIDGGLHTFLGNGPAHANEHVLEDNEFRYQCLDVVRHCFVNYLNPLSFALFVRSNAGADLSPGPAARGNGLRPSG